MNSVIKTAASISLAITASKSVSRSATSTAASREMDKIASNTVSSASGSYRCDVKV